jgi:hypothetical protein
MGSIEGVMVYRYVWLTNIPLLEFGAEYNFSKICLFHYKEQRLLKDPRQNTFRNMEN